MRRVSGVIGILALCSVVLAGDLAPVAAPAAAPAVAPVASAPVLTTKFSGDVLYRWQFDYNDYSKSNGDDSLSTGDFSNRYWWNFRFSATVNQNLGISMRLSNPKGYYTDNVSTNLIRSGLSNISNIVSIPELCFKWTTGIVTLSGGIIPVGMPPVTNTALDLVAFETKEVGDSIANAGYTNAGIMPWFVATNGSQMGLDLALAFYKSDMFSVGLDAIATVAYDRAASLTSEIFKRDQMRFICMVPMDMLKKMITVTPTIHVRTNVYRSADIEEGNHSVTGGIDLGVKPITQLALKAGFAAGGYKNDCLEDNAGYKASAPLGLLLNAGVAVMPGFGKGTVDFAWGNWQDREMKPTITKNSVLYWDILYDLPVKSLILRPRVRIWDWSNSATDYTRVMVRPELDFIAKF
jgi:hypothetical protein